jgi:TolA-binding protein
MSLFGSKSEPTPAAPEPTPQPQHKPVVQSARSTAASPAYGIGEVIKLMRTLPVDQNPELVVRVIKGTLESLNVHLTDIIDDATKKQQKVQERINALDGEISELTKQIETRRQEIGRMKTDLNETTTARQRLELADKAPSAGDKAPQPASVGPAVSPAAGIRVPSVKPPAA